MRALLAGLLVAIGAAFAASPSQAADMYYPPIEIPDVDYGVEGSFYLRGSLAVNYMWSREVTYDDPCLCAAIVSPVTTAGYGYSFGAGFGYETGTGLRTDFTLDYLNSVGLSDGTYELTLRSTIAMANAYYDFPLSTDDYGGFGAYVGAGIGAAYNQTSVTGPGAGPDGANWTAAAALMSGVTYDMGSVVADLGYRLLYMPQITNGSAAMLPVGSPYYINENLIHELRGTLRYRFN
jgi:opacity protein-like surface antigen